MELAHEKGAVGLPSGTVCRCQFLWLVAGTLSIYQYSKSGGGVKLPDKPIGTPTTKSGQGAGEHLRWKHKALACNLQAGATKIKNGRS